MATKSRKGEKKPLTAATLSQKTKKGDAEGKFYRLRDGNFVKLSGAPSFWQKDPNLIYLAGFYWVGNYNELYHALQLEGYSDELIRDFIEKQGISGQNYQTTHAQLFDFTVNLHSQHKAKNAEQKRIEDEESYRRLDAYRAEKERLATRNIGVVVDSQGRTTTTGAGRGGASRQYTKTLQERVDEARAKGKVVNVSKILEANAVDAQNRYQSAKLFPIVDVPDARSRDYRHVPGLNITANNLNAYLRAADILGASQQTKDAIRAQFGGAGPILSPAMQQIIGVPPQFGAPGTSTQFAPSFPVATQPVSTFNQVRQVAPATFVPPQSTFPAPTQFQPQTQFAPAPTQFQPTQFAPASQFAPVPQPVPILPPQPSPVRQTIAPVVPGSPSRVGTPPRATSPILPPARTSPRVSPPRASPRQSPSRLVGGVPPMTTVGGGSPRAASPLAASPVAPVRLSPRTSPLRTAPTQTMTALQSPGRSALPMPSQLQ